jgi:hypothetical protein
VAADLWACYGPGISWLCSVFVSSMLCLQSSITSDCTSLAADHYRKWKRLRSLVRWWSSPEVRAALARATSESLLAPYCILAVSWPADFQHTFDPLQALVPRPGKKWHGLQSQPTPCNERDSESNASAFCLLNFQSHDGRT